MGLDTVLHADRFGSASAVDTAGLFISAIIFTVFAFSNVVTATGPDVLFSHTAYFASVGVSWLVIVGQSMWMRSNGNGESN